MADLERLVVRIDADLKDFQKKMARIRAIIGAATKAVDGGSARVNSGFRKWSQGIDGAKRKAEQLNQSLGETIRQGKKAGDALSGGANKARSSMSGLAGALQRVRRNAAGFNTSMQRVRRTTERVNRSIFSLRNAMLGLGGGVVIRSLFRAGVEMERIENSLTAATGSAEAAGEAFEFVSEEAERLGLDLQTAGRGFAQLSAAAQGTALEGQAIRDIFTGVAEAATALALSPAEASGAITAITQIIGKGVVSMEELRQQLAERVPGAFQIAARAMGLTTRELNKLISSGELAAEDFLPKFAAELRRSFGPGVERAIEGAQASLNKFNNELFRIRVEISRSGFLDALTDSLKDIREQLSDPAFRQSLANLGELLGNAFRFLVENAETILRVLAAVKFATGGALAGAAAGTIIPGVGTAVGGLAGAAVGGTVGFLAPEIIEGVNSFATDLDKSAQNVRRSVDSIDAEIKRLRDSIETATANRPARFKAQIVDVSDTRKQIAALEAQREVLLSFERDLQISRGPQAILEEIERLQNKLEDGTIKRVRFSPVEIDREEIKRQIAELEEILKQSRNRQLEILSRGGPTPATAVPVLSTADGDGGGGGLTEAQTGALQNFRDTVNAIQDEIRVLSVDVSQREALAAVIQAENALREEGLRLSSDQRRELENAIATRQRLQGQDILADLEAEGVALEQLANTAVDGADSFENLRVKIEATNQVIALGIDPASNLGRALAEQIQINNRLATAVDNEADAWERAKDVIRETETPTERLRRQKEELTALLPKLIVLLGDEARAAEILQRALEKLGEETDKTAEFARDLGLAFTSAFEDAIVEGAALSDILRALEKDILRLLTRRILTEPILAFLPELILGLRAKQKRRKAWASAKSLLRNCRAPKDFSPISGLSSKASSPTLARQFAAYSQE
jgi:tape measure domain-containing protein